MMHTCLYSCSYRSFCGSELKSKSSVVELVYKTGVPETLDLTAILHVTVAMHVKLLPIYLLKLTVLYTNGCYTSHACKIVAYLPAQVGCTIH